MSDDSFLLEIQDEFLEEALGYIEEVENCFLQLETNPSDDQILQRIFRLAHNIKGSAAAVGFDDLASFAHLFENLLTKIKSREIPPNPQVVDVLLAGNDTIKRYLNALKSDKKALVDTSITKQKISDLIENKNGPSQEVAPSQKETEQVSENNSYKNIGEILVENKLITEDQLEKAAETQTKKIGEILIDQGALTKEGLTEALEKQEELNKNIKKPEEFIRLPLGKLEDLLNHFSEQVILQSNLDHLKMDIQNNKEPITRTINLLNKITFDLQQTVISLRMVSLKNVFNKMQRTIRDTAKMLEKEVRFIMEGEDLELDKTLVDELSSPITHLVRNSVDHGLEIPSIRIQNGKKPEGFVKMSASHKGRYFYLEIEDDGKGLDKNRIEKKAIEKGLISANHNLKEKDIYDLIFKSGFSTKDEATSVSGRGVGMDVVKQSIEKLRGDIEIQSVPGKGTKTIIKLPPTLAIFNGIIVALDDKKYVIPNSDVLEIFRISRQDIRMINEREKIVKIKEQVYPIIDLKRIFKHSTTNKVVHNKDAVLLLVIYNRKNYCLEVDDILRQQRIVFKTLGKEIEHLPGIAGGTILGDGKIALIAEVNAIIEIHKTT